MSKRNVLHRNTPVARRLRLCSRDGKARATLRRRAALGRVSGPRCGDPARAAAETGAQLLELAVPELANGGWDRIGQAISGRGAARVLLVPDAAALLQPEHRSVLEALREAARSCREAGLPFFVVLVDPEARLALPPLYKERAPK